MKILAVLLCLLILAPALTGCVPADQHENLKNERDELRQTLDTRERMLEDARKNAHRAVALIENDNRELKRNLRYTKKDLQSKQSQLDDLQGRYRNASDEVSRAAANSLDLIKEKNALNATIIELRGSIATLQDTVKDLRQRLAEATQPEPESSDQPAQAPQ